MSYPPTLGRGPLDVGEAYEALDAFAVEYGRDPLLLLLHAAVPESLRVDLLALIRLNFMPGHAEDPSLDADVLFAPLTTEVEGGYFRIDPQVRWHCLALLRSLYRDEPRSRQRRVAELLWRYAEAMEQHATRAADPMLAEFLDIQRWVALAFLDPAQAAHAFAQALRHGSEAPPGTAALLRLGGLASAIELPLAGEQELLSYARGLDALARGDDDQAERLLGRLGDAEIRVGGIALRSPAALLRQRQGAAQPGAAPVHDEAPAAASASRRGPILCIAPFGRRVDRDSGREHDFDAMHATLRATVVQAGLVYDRIDPISVGTAHADLFRALLDADVVVCDVTLPDPTVLLLLGIAMALRPPGALLIAERDARVWSSGFAERFAYPRAEAPDRLASGAWTRFGERLASAAASRTARASPVYARLPGLQSPLWFDRADAPAVTGSGCLVLHGGGTPGRQAIEPGGALSASVREAVAHAGLACVSFNLAGDADAFDSAVLEQLLGARLVVADVSAGRPEVLLALGLRFALRPAGTIVLADASWPVPFTLMPAHLLRYESGSGAVFGKAQAQMLQRSLRDWIDAALASPAVDSPVYLALPQLRPPQLPPSPPAPAPARVKVFFSYVHEYRDTVRRLAAALPAEIDIEASSDMDLQPGEAWDASLRAMLEAADAVIVIAGRLTQGRSMQMAIIRGAIGLGKRVIPVFVDPFTEPSELLSRQCANTDRQGRIAYLGTLRDKALDEAIDRCAANIVSVLHQPASPSPSPSPPPPSRTTLEARDITLTQPADGVLEFAFEEGGSQRLQVKYQPSLVNRLLEPLVADTRSPAEALGTLAHLLLPRELTELPRPERWRLTLAPEAAVWPWELLLSHRASAPLAPAAVFRRLAGVKSRAAPQPHRRTALVVSTPQTQGTLPEAASGLPPLPGAVQEAAAVAAVLRSAGYAVEVSEGEDARSVLSRLFADEYQLVLVTGNAVRDHALTGGRTVTGFVLSDGAFLTSLEIGQMRILPELMFLNGCHTGLVSAGQTRGPLAEPMVPKLLRSGVRCVVAPAWAVDDPVAALFSQRCFEALCSGSTFENACADARQAAFDAAPGGNTWAAYQAWGDTDFTLGATASA